MGLKYSIYGNGNNNENSKKAVGLDWQNNNFVHFFAVVAWLRSETA